jgi:PAS domain S-box-containing protein
MLSRLLMKTSALPLNESQRLQRLQRLGLLDTEAEAVLDGFTQLAASVTGMPIALISLIDHDRQWWKSAVGLPQGGGTRRDHSFCSHAIAQDEALFEVEDARLDARFSDNPLVRSPPHVVHYAGVPLVMPGGERVGTVCVIDDQPGKLSPQTREILTHIAKCIVNVLLLRESERTQRERALTEAKFKLIAEAVPQMVWSALPDGQPDYFNQRWYDFTGMPPGVVGTEPFKAMLHPEERGSAWATWQSCLLSGQPYQTEYRLRHVSGDYRWVLVRALAVCDEQCTVMRWMGSCTDIQDQKLAQEELRVASHRKDEFLAMLAHELRNPLAPLSTAAQLLQMAPHDPERVRRSAELMERQVRHMTELVDDLLDVSRVTRGLVQVDHDVVELQQVAQGALEQARPHIEARQHSVEVELPSHPLHVRGDRVRLIQVVSNLLNNAAKYTPLGGHIALRLSQEPGQAQACITVSDNGSGIEPALLRHVFELFTQGQRTPDRAQGGLGLGLALVKSIVELHAGHVQASSAGAGQGSRFTVCLPTMEVMAHELPAASPSPAPGSGCLRVVVVDDNLDAGHMLGQWLQALGHEAVVMGSPQEALARTAPAKVDVFLLDIGLPHMDGYELARQLRTLPCPSHLHCRDRLWPGHRHCPVQASRL